MAKVSVRYIVDDVDAALDFYCRELGFDEVMHPAASFAMLTHSELRLVLTSPGAARAVGKPCPTGAFPSPAAGTASSLRSTTSKPSSAACGITEPASAMTS